MYDFDHVFRPFPRHLASPLKFPNYRNIDNSFFSTQSPEDWYAVEVCGGAPVTFAKEPSGNILVANNDHELYIEGKNGESTPYRVILEEMNIKEILEPGMVIQGEIIGEDIDDNPYNVDGVMLRIFRTQRMSDVSYAYRVLSPYFAHPLNISFPTSHTEAQRQRSSLLSTLNTHVPINAIAWFHKNNQSFPELEHRHYFIVQ